MKVAAYTSDVAKLSLMSSEYEKHKADGYPIALFDSEKNNAIYGRNQFLIGELLRLADKLLHQPITNAGETLYFFQIAMLNQKSIYQNAIVNHATTSIPKVSALNNKKLNPRIAAEIDNKVQFILKHSLSEASSLNKEFEVLIADVLGVSLISTCIKEFFSLRLNARNYILKALRYIIFDSSINDAVYTELNELKKKYFFSFHNFNEVIAKELLVFYKIGTHGCKHENLIYAISSICRTHTKSYYFDIPLLLAKLSLDKTILSKVDQICKFDFSLGQILIYALKHLKKKDITEYLNRILYAIEVGATEHNVLSLVLQYDAKDYLKLPPEPKLLLLQEVNPGYLELVKKAYLLQLNNGISRRTTFFWFLENYLLTGFYIHSEHASRTLSRLLEGDVGLTFISKVNEIENIFSKNQSDAFFGAKYNFMCQLLCLIITSNNNPIERFSLLINHDLLSKKIPNRDFTYEEAIRDFSSLDSYMRLFESHNPLLAKIELLHRFYPHQFELHNVFDFSIADIPVKLLKNSDDFKKSLHSPAFMSACSKEFLRLIELGNLVVVSFGDDFEFYAVINVSKLNFVGDYCYGLMKVIGVDITPEQYMDAIKITHFMNENRTSTLK